MIADCEIGGDHSLSRGKLSSPAFDAPRTGSGNGMRFGASYSPDGK
jgi:hypothetical protein